jgi:hypothetical protein
MLGRLLFRERLRLHVCWRIRGLLRVPVLHVVPLLRILLREVRMRSRC